MPEAVQAAAALSVRTWSTPDDTAIAFEDEETGDGRIFSSGALKWDRRPMPLQYADEMLMGHQGAELAGAIKAVKRDGKRITASGVLYSTRPAGADAIQLLDEEAPLGISVDLDDVDIEFVDKTLSPEDADWLFASATLPQASVLRLDDGSVMLSGATRAEWTASEGRSPVPATTSSSSPAGRHPQRVRYPPGVRRCRCPHRGRRRQRRPRAGPRRLRPEVR